MRKGDTNPNSATFSVVNAEDRLFKIWATVEVFDTQGQRVPIEIFKAVVPKLLSRTVPFHLEHTNKAVGEAVNYEFGMHPELNAEGCLVTGKIYRGFQLDDEAWRGVQQNSLMASIGGQSSSNKPGDLDWVAPCEIALTKKGANPGARIMEVAAMAKSDMSVEQAHEIIGHPTHMELLAILQVAIGKRLQAAEVLQRELMAKSDMTKVESFSEWLERRYKITPAGQAKLITLENFKQEYREEMTEIGKSDTAKSEMGKGLYPDDADNWDNASQSERKKMLDRAEISNAANWTTYKLKDLPFGGRGVDYKTKKSEIGKEANMQKPCTTEGGKMDKSADSPRSGKEQQAQIPSKERCPVCNGTGVKSPGKVCNECGGSGMNKSMEKATMKKAEVGDEVTIPSDLTSDPKKKQGETGKVVKVDSNGDVHVKFSDGVVGIYEEDAVMEKSTVTVTDEKKPEDAKKEEAPKEVPPKEGEAPAEGKPPGVPPAQTDAPPAAKEAATPEQAPAQTNAPSVEERMASIEKNMVKVMEFMQKATEQSAAAAPVKETEPVKPIEPEKPAAPEAPAKPEAPEKPKEAAKEEKPKEKSEEEKKEGMAKAAVADMQKSAQPAPETPRPEVAQMAFDPNKAGTNTSLPSTADIKKGAKLDTLEFVRNFFASPRALQS